MRGRVSWFSDKHSIKKQDQDQEDEGVTRIRATCDSGRYGGTNLT